MGEGLRALISVRLPLAQYWERGLGGEGESIHRIHVNLDIFWLKDEREEENGELPEPAILAQEAIRELEAAIAELQGILQELGEDISL